jgi:hypothetical protein
MDIESFYEQNEARRESAEFEFGSEWTDASDNEYELSWVEATGELYLMVEPEAIVNEDIFGDFLVSDEVVSDLTVVVIGKVAVARRARGHAAGLGRRDARRELPRVAVRAVPAET